MIVSVASAWGQVETPRQAERTRDTVVIIQRDTVVMMRKDTVYFQQIPADRTQAPANSRQESRDERVDRLRSEREDLRQLRRQEYEEWLAAQPVRRGPGISYAIKYYPTQLLKIDFPSVGFGVERTIDGRFSLEGMLGFLVRPTPFNDWSEQRPGRARFGLRGIRVGLSGRYYTSDTYKNFPFYIGGEYSYAIAPVEIDLWVPGADGSFERNIQAPVNGQSNSISAFCGWELRTESKLVIDFSTGLTLGIKGLQSRSEFVQRAIDDRFWNLGNANRTVFGDVMLRMGIGFGDWQPRSEPSTKETGKRRSKRSKKRRR